MKCLLLLLKRPFSYLNVLRVLHINLSPLLFLILMILLT